MPNREIGTASTQSTLVVPTPWERYDVAGFPVWVKREDLCCPEGPRFSKIRGLQRHLSALPPDTTVGVLDTVHSKGGWGTAYVCNALGMRCVVFYPGPEPREGQIRALGLGATLVSLRPGRSAILHHRARKALADFGPNVHLLPNGLQLKESIQATYEEALGAPPELLHGGTWVVSASTGTIATGVNKALLYTSGKPELVAHLGFSRSIPAMGKKVGPARFVDEGYSYRDLIDFPCPFPCNPYYDLKAWKWLVENVHTLAPPVAFWNIGE